MFDYTELNKLWDMCQSAGWNVIKLPCWEGQQIILKDIHGTQLNDTVIHGFSYGHEQGLLETWHETEWDDVEGYLTAEQVFAIWRENIHSHEIAIK